MCCHHGRRITFASTGKDFKLHETTLCHCMDIPIHRELLSKGQEEKLDALGIDKLEGVNDYWISQAQLTSFGEGIDTIIDSWTRKACFELVVKSVKQNYIVQSDTQSVAW